MSNVDVKTLDTELQLKLDLGEPPTEINDRNEDQQLARWAARERAARIGGDD